MENNDTPTSAFRLIDSPWLWGLMFSLMALVGLGLIRPKFDVRQSQIEGRFLGRRQSTVERWRRHIDGGGRQCAGGERQRGAGGAAAACCSCHCDASTAPPAPAARPPEPISSGAYGGAGSRSRIAASAADSSTPGFGAATARPVCVVKQPANRAQRRSERFRRRWAMCAPRSTIRC